MLIEKLNCDFLKLSPFSYENGYNTGTIKALQISAKANDGILVTKSIDLTTPTNKWSVDFLGSAGMYIKQVYVRNIFTNQLFPLLPSTPLILSRVNIEAVILPMVQSVIRLNFNSPTVTALGSFTGDMVNFTISNLPSNLVMDRVTLTLLGIDQDAYFSFLSNNDLIVSNNTVLLRPSFFNMEKFIDGIYSVTSIVTTTSNMLIEETGCFFFDCEMAGKLQAITDKVECDPHKMHLLLMHYTLTQASNNACSCDSMYDIFSYLSNNLNQVTNEDCGCK